MDIFLGENTNLTILCVMIISVFLYTIYYYSKEENIQKEVDKLIEIEAQNEIPLHIRLNNKQKIFTLVGVGSLFLFIVSISFLQWDIGQPFFFWESAFGDNSPKAHINYIGLISLFNIIVSLTGFFLFKDK